MENLIIKYLNEIATVQEKYLLFEWLKCSNDNKKKFREIQQIWLASENAEQKETKTAQAYNLLKESIEVCEQRKKIMFKLSLFKTIAAASVLLAIFSLGSNITLVVKSLKRTSTFPDNRVVSIDVRLG